MYKNKTIIVMSDSLGHGGLQKMASYLAETCLDSFDKVYLIALSQDETKQDINNAIIVKKLHYNRTENHLENTIAMFKTAIELRKHIKEIKPDIICSMGTVTLFVTQVATFLKKIKLIGSERNSPMYYSRIWKFLNNLMFKLSDGVVFQTKDAMDYHGVSIAKKSTVIPNPYTRKGKPLDFFEGERDNTITTAAARFEHKKGIDILIAAFSEVLKKHPEYRLVIYGQGKLYNEYIQQTKKLKIENSVDFPGLVSDVASAVHKSKVFVLPSRFEGVPNVLMEVMGAGVPTVASNCHPGGPKLLTDNGRYGILVPVDNVLDMANAINKLIEDKELSDQLGREGMKYIRNFSKENIGDMWISYFKKILEK